MGTSPTNKYSDHRTYSSVREEEEREQEKLADIGGGGPEEAGGVEGVGGGLEKMALSVICGCLCILASSYVYYTMKVRKFRVE